MRIAFLSALLLFAVPVQSTERILGHFSAGDTAGWETKVFNGATDYRIAEQDGRRVLAAVCRDSASAMYRREKISLRETPVLRWSWRVGGAYAGLDETRKDGDDYLARLYVVIDGGIRFWRTRSLNYVWASGRPPGSAWPNAYARQVMMLALRTGPDAAWREESRDLRRDFREQFGIEADHVDGVALMTDCDDAHGHGRAWYGDIRFADK
jgi:hypothetical protein